MIGVPERSAMPSMSGESWFGVEVTARVPSDCLTSQAQPDPKRVNAAFVKASLRASKLPNLESMAEPSSPDGYPPPEGEMVFQKKE